MKKSGYTLAEILIALTIAGIVAGLVLPMAGKIRPNANKMAFLHTYDSIVQLTHSIAADETFYPEIDVDEGGKINYGNYPLWNIRPKSPDGNTYYGQAKKYCQILAEGLKADSNACSNNTITPFGNQKSFTTPNGVDFWVNTERGKEDVNNDGTDDFAIYQSSVHFDVNGIDQGENCIYNAGTCPHPDRFTLFVASDGKVVAADQMSQHYLNTRTNFRFNKDEVPNINALAILVDADRKKKINYIEEIPELELPEGTNIDLVRSLACGDEFGDTGRIVNCISIAEDGSTRLKSAYPPASDLKVSVQFKLDGGITKTFQFDFFKGENYSPELSSLPDFMVQCGGERCTYPNGLGYDFALATKSVGLITPFHDDKYQYMSEEALRIYNVDHCTAQ